jgi:hypothetical protein
MPTDTIMQYGAFGVLSFILIWLTVKAVPMFKNWLDGLLLTFKDEIAIERALGEKRVQDEREAAAKVSAKQMQTIDKHTQAVDAMRQTLAQLVEKSNRA